MLLLEAALEDELVVAVDGRAGGTQLGSEEGQQMLGLTMQPENDQQSGVSNQSKFQVCRKLSLSARLPLTFWRSP